MGTRIASVTAALALMPLFLTARQLPQSKPDSELQPARIKVSTELMQISAVVTDRSGNVVDLLSKDDFLLREDGGLQPVAFFSVKRKPVLSAPESGGATKLTVDGKVPTGSPANAASIAHSIVLLVDDLHTSFESLAAVRTALHRFVDEQLTDQDITCLKTTTGRLGVIEQFTQNREILSKGIDKILPWRITEETLFTPFLAGRILQEDKVALVLGELIMEAEEGESGVGKPLSAQLARQKATMILAEARYQRLVMVSTAAAVVDKLADMPGQRLIAMFSDGFTSAGPEGETAITDLHPIISRAARSGVKVYTFNAKGPFIPMIPASMSGGSAVASQKGDERMGGQLLSYVNASELDLTHGLSVLASETGGAFFNNTNDLAGRLEKMLDENSIWYELAYYPPPGKDPGKTRSIAIAIKDHPEYKVRAQKSYVLSDLRQSNPEPEPQTGQGRLHRAMSQALPVSDIGVSASVQTIPDTDQRKLNVWIRGEDLGFRSEGDQPFLDLEVETVIFDSQGKTVKTSRESLRRPVLQEQIEKLKKEDLQYVSRLDLKPGIYQIRIGVRDVASSHMGTGVVWFEIPKPAKAKQSRRTATGPP